MNATTERTIWRGWEWKHGKWRLVVSEAASLAECSAELEKRRTVRSPLTIVTGGGSPRWTPKCGNAAAKL